MLSQQIADVNQDWYPKWCSDDVKYCIVRDCIGHSYKLTVEECTLKPLSQPQEILSYNKYYTRLNRI
jgi:hypothetical protein